MRKFLSFFALVLVITFGFSQDKQQVQVKRATVAFLNVENLWDTIPSADYIDGTLPINNPAFHRSVPIHSLKFLPVTEEYKGQWSDELLIGKKVIRYQNLADDFTPKSAKNYNSKVYQTKLANESKVISELGYQYTKTLPAIVGLIEVENRQVVQRAARHQIRKSEERSLSLLEKGAQCGRIDSRGRDMRTDPVNGQQEETHQNSLLELRNFRDIFKPIDQF